MNFYARERGRRKISSQDRDERATIGRTPPTTFPRGYDALISLITTSLQDMFHCAPVLRHQHNNTNTFLMMLSGRGYRRHLHFR